MTGDNPQRHRSTGRKRPSGKPRPRAGAAGLRVQRASAVPPTKVLVVGTDATFIEAVGSQLAGRRKIDIVGNARNLMDAVERTVLLRPDVIVMDINLGYELGGVDAVLSIRKIAPACGFVIISPYKDRPRLAMLPRRVGLEWSYLLVETARQEGVLADAINAASWGIAYIDPAVDRHALGATERSIDDAISEALGRRRTRRLPEDGGTTRWNGRVQSFSLDDLPPDEDR